MRLQPADQLFLLGDYVNKGPDSRGVVDYILHLQQSGYNVYPIRGNHENRFLYFARKDYESADRYFRLNGTAAFFENFRMPERYLRFFDDLPCCLRTGDNYLVHAGFRFRKPEPFLDYYPMMNVRKPEINNDYLCSRRVIFGHNPRPLQDIRRDLADRRQLLGLDNRCYKPAPGYGRLLCLDLRNDRLYLQPNIDNPNRKPPIYSS